MLDYKKALSFYIIIEAFNSKFLVHISFKYNLKACQGFVFIPINHDFFFLPLLLFFCVKSFVAIILQKKTNLNLH